MIGIEIDVSYAGTNDEVVIMSARGYIDSTTSPEFSKRLGEQLALKKYKFIINLEGIDYISSTGWGVFVVNLQEMRDNYGDLVLANMVPGVHNIYELMEFSSIIKSFKSLNEAKAFFIKGEVVEEKPGKAETIKAGATAGKAEGEKTLTWEEIKKLAADGIKIILGKKVQR